MKTILRNYSIHSSIQKSSSHQALQTLTFYSVELGAMKKLTINKSGLALILSIFILAALLPGCFGEKYNIEYPKVKNPEEVSNSCAANTGLNDQEIQQLAKVLKNNGSRLNDEFKLDAMLIITESDNVAPEDRNNVENAYFSCIEQSTETK